MATKLVIDFSQHEVAVRVFDEAFAHPRRKYIIRPVDVNIAREWLQKNARMLAHGWPTGSDWATRLRELGPMRKGDLMPLEELSNMRNRCGWFSGEDGDDQDYYCDHPANHERTNRPGGKGLCFAYTCPIAYEADREDVRRKDHEWFVQEFKGVSAQPVDWVVLHTRPRWAWVPNVTVLGCEGWEA